MQKTAGSVTTSYLVDTNNPSGYAQVFEELQDGTVVRKYSYGLALISETQALNGQTASYFYLWDGHSGVRAVTSAAGAVSDTYTYDAFGNLIEHAGTTPNVYLYEGQQFDSDLDLYYNRARYLDVRTGRFWAMDTFEGDPESPLTLHKYLYTGDEPIGLSDPSGQSYLDTIIAVAVQYSLVTQTLIGAAVGGAGGCIAGALSNNSTCRQGFYSGLLGGAVFGALGGLYGATAFGASSAGRLLLTFAVTGLGGSAAYSAARKGDYALAAFDAVLTIGSAFLGYLSISSTPAAGAAADAGANPAGALPARYAFLRSINPSGSNTNCANCAAAVDNVLAGGAKEPACDCGVTDITALSARYGNQWMSAGGTLKGAVSAFQSSGSGSRGIIFGGYNDPTVPGHVFNIENYNGVVYLLDGQSGGTPVTSGYEYFWFLRTN